MFDGIGLIIGQKENGIDIKGKSALLLGAGGAARAIAFAYLQEGVTRLGVYNRTATRAEKLVADIKAAMPDADVVVATADPTGYEVICNCTSLGLHEGDPVPADIDKLQSHMDVVDIIAVRDTELMDAAKAKGCKVIGGVPMAVGQLAAFAKFFDPAQNT
jgi:shikimate dehydrogenase